MVARASGPTSIELHDSFKLLEQFADDLINFENILCRHTQGHTRSLLRQGHLNFADCGYLSLALPPPGPVMSPLQQKVHNMVDSLQLVELNLDVTLDAGFLETISGWLCLPVLKKLRLLFDVDLVGNQSSSNDFTTMMNLRMSHRLSKVRTRMLVMALGPARIPAPPMTATATATTMPKLAVALVPARTRVPMTTAVSTAVTATMTVAMAVVTTTTVTMTTALLIRKTF